MKLLPRRTTLRARLTLIYSGLFLLAGMVLLGATYALFSQQLARPTKVLATFTNPSTAAGDGAEPRYQTYALGEEGLLTGDEAQRWWAEQEARLRDAATTSLLTQGGLALGAVAVMATGLGWLVSGRVLAPLHRVTDTARRIAAAPAADHGLHERIALRGPHDDVKDLADAFDTMVERLDRSFDGQRRFVANASHELRTPLTLSRAMVELAMHRSSASADVRQLGESLLQISTRHERLITGLLLLARSDNEITDRRPVDLADVIAHVVDQTTAAAAEAGITVDVAAAESPTAGDALLLERLVHNLLDNGLRHNTGPGGWVRITSRVRDHAVELRVSNSGPAVPPYEVPALFEPFRRLEGDHPVTAKGAGLGLSIVRAIAGAHGGAVSARPGERGGLIVTVTLPSRADPSTVE